MKKSLLLALVAISLNQVPAFAIGISTIARCSTTGDAISGVVVGIKDSDDLLRIQIDPNENDADQESQVYLADLSPSEAKAIRAGGKFLVTGKDTDSAEIGGIVTKAVLFAGQIEKKAEGVNSRLAVGGSVFNLKCVSTR